MNLADRKQQLLAEQQQLNELAVKVNTRQAQLVGALQLVEQLEKEDAESIPESEVGQATSTEEPRT